MGEVCDEFDDASGLVREKLGAAKGSFGASASRDGDNNALR
jgi:hypothetical protein